MKTHKSHLLLVLLASFALCLFNGCTKEDPVSSNNDKISNVGGGGSTNNGNGGSNNNNSGSNSGNNNNSNTATKTLLVDGTSYYCGSESIVQETNGYGMYLKVVAVDNNKTEWSGKVLIVVIPPSRVSSLKVGDVFQANIISVKNFHGISGYEVNSYSWDAVSGSIKINDISSSTLNIQIQSLSISHRTSNARHSISGTASLHIYGKDGNNNGNNSGSGSNNGGSGNGGSGSNNGNNGGSGDSSGSNGGGINIGTTIHTVILFDNVQPPIVGGIIDNYSASSIKEKGIIVSTNSTDVQLKNGVSHEHPYVMYAELKDYRVINCTNYGAEQFWHPLKALKGNKDYYFRVFAIMTDGSVIYGDLKSLRSMNMSRYNDRTDYGNVFHAFDYTLFDLATDEIINPNDGFYYSTNENPDTVKHQIGTISYSCYKFASEWNYKLWRYNNDYFWKEDRITHVPILSYKNGKVEITQNPVDTNRTIKIMYKVNDYWAKPESYSKYTVPISVNKGDIVAAYGIDNDGHISFTNVYRVE